MDSFCGSPFWDSNVTWNTDNPRFTPCFHKTVLVWIPCAFLWIFSPMEIYIILKNKNRYIPWTFLNVTKIVLTSILMLLCLADLCYQAYLDSFEDNPPVYPAYYYAPLIQLATFMLELGLTLARRLHGIFSSGIQFFFWFVLLLCSLFTYIDFLKDVHESIQPSLEPDNFEFTLYMIFFPLVLVQFLLNLKADSKPQYLHYLDTSSPKTREYHPESFASFPSKLIFWWFNGLIIKGYKQPLTQNDLWKLRYEDSTSAVVPKFESFWNKEMTKMAYGKEKNAIYNTHTQTALITQGNPPKSKTKQPSIIKAFFFVFGPTFLSGAIFKFFYDLLQFVSPQILRLVIEFIEGSTSEPLWKGIFFAGLLLLSATTQSLCLSYYFYRMYIVGIRYRTCLISSIFKKAMLMSNHSRKQTTMGEIVNLMSVDVQKISDLMPFANLIWSAPLQIVLSLYFLYQILGPSVFAGVAVMVLLLPVNAYIALITKKLQMQQMKTKDERVKMMNEILNGIKVLKFFAWEYAFMDFVTALRKREVQKLKKMALIASLTTFFWTCAPFMVALVTFATYVLSDENNHLDASKAFVSLTLFNILRFPLTMLPMMITLLIQALVSVKRINDYLTGDELEDYVINDKLKSTYPISIHEGSFAWSKNEPAILKEINLTIPPYSLVAVVGPVGCGKSSLLSSVLGDMDKLEGQVHLQGSVAYASQLAWIQNATLRDNILFYKPYNPEKYKNVIQACALEPDIAILQAGDLTEIGERGINLSGGQKQRVSIARAVYQDADIYLLDDPLSAVDAHVGKHIFQNVLGPQGLLKNKTRVLVTHGIAFLPLVDLIVVMSDGSIAEIGTYKELLEKKGAFADFLLQYLSSTDENVEDIEDVGHVLEDIVASRGVTPQLSRQISQISSNQENMMSHKPSWERSSSQHSIPHTDIKHRSSKSSLDRRESKAEVTNNAKIMTIETSETGKVKKKVYLQYFKSMSFTLVALILLGYSGLQAFSVGSNYWLSDWANDNSTHTSMRDFRLTIYGLFGLGQGLSVLLASGISAIATMRASRVLHKAMLWRVLHCPMSFFETTPLGRIVNRFSKDIDTVDMTLPHNFRSWLLCTLQVVSIIIVISHQTPIFLTIVGPIACVYYFIQMFYVATSRQLKRLESITKSPVYSFFGETLAGVATIRAYKAGKRFAQECHRLVDTNISCFYPSIVANRWLEIRLELCGNLIVFFATLFSVLNRDSLSPGSVGLTISYALSVTATLNWMVRMSSELETNIVSVERIKEYLALPIEAPWENEAAKPEPEWPDKGKIVFDHYSTRYRDGLDLVLHEVSAHINEGEKVGIVGRTGAGKSSLTLGLFRIIEAASGAIVIDGKNISSLGLHDLRSKITIIPQDPILFSGTLRMNLDPLNRYSDDDLWNALEQAHLKAFITTLTGGLSYIIAEGGSNLSVGQCQLVCLARALLKKTRVLVLDEATAAVDLETDDLIQATIRTSFAECTVLTIAHRLNTIMDYNRIMVLDKGKIVEFDSPSALLKDTKSLFYGMAHDAGIV